MIQEGVKLGHHMMANTTVFKETDVDEVEELCKLLTDIGVEGMLVSPGYHYESVGARHLPDEVRDPEEVPARPRDLQEVQAHLDADVPGVRGRPARVQVLALEHRDLHAQRLEGPLLPDRQDVPTRSRSSGTAPTGTTGSRGRTPSAQNCAMHSGFEASVVRELPKHPGDMVRMIAWNLAAWLRLPQAEGDLVTGGTGFVGSARRSRAPRREGRAGPLPRPAGQPARQPRGPPRRDRRGRSDRPLFALARHRAASRRSTTSPPTTGSGRGTRRSSSAQRRRDRERPSRPPPRRASRASSTRAPSARSA